MLAPDRYVDQRVTMQGQFRGRNLFGDQPQAPPGGDGRKEFVLRSADAALWVTGKVPKGRGFTFDIASRLDTRRWLEVSGVVKEDRGLVWIVAEELAETSPQAEKAPERIVSSAPADAAGSAVQRADQRRNRRAAEHEGPRAVLAGHQSRHPEGQRPDRLLDRAGHRARRAAGASLEAKLNYNRGTRVMEIVFGEPLERFRTIE